MYRSRIVRTLVVAATLACCLLTAGSSRAAIARDIPREDHAWIAAPPDNQPPPVPAAEEARRIAVLAADPARRVNLMAIAGDRRYDNSDRVEAFSLVLLIDMASRPPDPVPVD